MHRFYHPNTININESLFMDNPSSHHALRVMRVKINDQIILFNGDGSDYQGKVINLKKNQIEVLIISKKVINHESHLKITLLQALTSNDKMDWIIQKATELGISEIQPVICDRSIIKIKDNKTEKKLLRWRQISISACEQCGRAKIPHIHPPQDLSNYLEKNKIFKKNLKIILSPDAKKNLNDIEFMSTKQEISVLIGPEGDFTKKELELAIKKGFLSVKIGPRILRTETAPISILSILQYKYGDIV